MERIRNKKLKKPVQYAKVFGLIFLLLFMLASTAQAESTSAEYEPVGNTTVGAAGTHNLNISIVTGYRSHALALSNITEAINGNLSLNLSVSYYTSDNVMENDVDLSSMDIVYINMLGPATAQKLNDTVEAAIRNGAVVIDDDTSLNESIPLDPSDVSDYKDALNELWLNGAYDKNNLINLVFKLARDFHGRTDLTDVPAKQLPDRAIYHTNMTEYTYFCENLNTYLDWYASRTDGGHIYDPARPTVGITLYSSYYPCQIEPIDALISELESRDVNVIATYGTTKLPSGDFFKQNNETLVDAIISYTYFGNKFDAEALGVPVINGITNNYMNRSEWEASSRSLPTDKMMKIDYPELWGAVDPIIMAATEIDPETNTEIPLSIDYQVDWMADRTLGWIDLSRIQENEKKVAIIYYNHGGGKDNIGASYLNVAPSICNLLQAMGSVNYTLDTENIPNETRLIDTMIAQGMNVGTWAPGELERLVSSGKVELLPEETYREWFEELPAERQQEVLDRWGPLPGNIMVWENEGKKYLVLPKIEVGDGVLLAPQPTRGWLQDNDALYHDKDLPPHHQYIAFYLWLQKEYEADAIVHFGRHGTQEWLPGKEFGLSRYDWPALMLGDIPVVYPYVMDGLGEGNQAKRRGGAVMIDHLVPPIIAAGSYGDYANLSTEIQNYDQAVDGTLKAAHRAEILNLTCALHLDERLNMSQVEDDTFFEDEFLEELDELLEELKTQSMPYGLHILGTAPKGEELAGMVNSMLGPDFRKDVALHNNTDGANLVLLDLVLNQGVNSKDAQVKVLGAENETIGDYLATAEEYAANLALGEEEIQQVLNALDGKFIPGNLGGDPVRNPGTLPSGRNFYAFDQRNVPTVQAWNLGTQMADQMLEAYKAEHGEYPHKVAYILWAGETTRHEGVMEAQIFRLLGVEPVRKKGKVTDVKFIPASELGRPRVDVVVQISGLYRDMYPDKVRLIDKAVQIAYAQDETPNYVRENTDALTVALMNETGMNKSEARKLALLRIFGSSDGAYGTGISNAVSASDTWENNSALAELYISKMSNAYGQDVWGKNVEDLFRKELSGVEVTMHSRSTNLYGTLDNDDFFQYMGSFNLAVSYLSEGKYPESYITNLLTPGAEGVETLGDFMARELSTRYFNPKWIEGMQKHGYAGAGEMADFIENLWGWEATNPDLISEDVWNQVYQTYVSNKELSDWFKSNNPYAYQAMTARMLETAHKGNWHASDEVLKSLASEYADSVVNDGVTCCHHTCGNPLLNSYVEGLVSVPGFRDKIDKATTEPEKTSPSKPHSKSHSSSRKSEVEPQFVSSESNQTTSFEQSDAGYGQEASDPVHKSAQPETAPDYVEGYEMQKEAVAQPDESGGMSFSGADIVGTLFVVSALGAVFLGLRRKRL